MRNYCLFKSYPNKSDHVVYFSFTLVSMYLDNYCILTSNSVNFLVTSMISEKLKVVAANRGHLKLHENMSVHQN